MPPKKEPEAKKPAPKRQKKETQEKKITDPKPSTSRQDQEDEEPPAKRTRPKKMVVESSDEDDFVESDSEKTMTIVDFVEQYTDLFSRMQELVEEKDFTSPELCESLGLSEKESYTVVTKKRVTKKELSNQFIAAYLHNLFHRLVRRHRILLWTEPFCYMALNPDYVLHFNLLFQRQGLQMSMEEFDAITEEQNELVESRGFGTVVVDVTDCNPLLSLLWVEFFNFIKYYNNPETPRHYVKRQIRGADDKLWHANEKLKMLKKKNGQDANENYILYERDIDEYGPQFLYVISNILDFILDTVEGQRSEANREQYFKDHKEELLSKIKFFGWVLRKEKLESPALEHNYSIPDNNPQVAIAMDVGEQDLLPSQQSLNEDSEQNPLAADVPEQDMLPSNQSNEDVLNLDDSSDSDLQSDEFESNDEPGIPEHTEFSIMMLDSEPPEDEKSALENDLTCMLLLVAATDENLEAANTIDTQDHYRNIEEPNENLLKEMAVSQDSQNGVTRYTPFTFIDRFGRRQPLFLSNYPGSSQFQVNPAVCLNQSGKVVSKSSRNSQRSCSKDLFTTPLMPEDPEQLIRYVNHQYERAITNPHADSESQPSQNLDRNEEVETISIPDSDEDDSVVNHTAINVPPQPELPLIEFSPPLPMLPCPSLPPSACVQIHTSFDTRNSPKSPNPSSSVVVEGISQLVVTEKPPEQPKSSESEKMQVTEEVTKDGLTQPASDSIAINLENVKIEHLTQYSSYSDSVVVIENQEEQPIEIQDSYQACSLLQDTEYDFPTRDEPVDPSVPMDVDQELCQIDEPGNLDPCSVDPVFEADTFVENTITVDSQPKTAPLQTEIVPLELEVTTSRRQQPQPLPQPKPKRINFRFPNNSKLPHEIAMDISNQEHENEPETPSVSVENDVLMQFGPLLASPLLASPLLARPLLASEIRTSNQPKPRSPQASTSNQSKPESSQASASNQPKPVSPEVLIRHNEDLEQLLLKPNEVSFQIHKIKPIIIGGEVTIEALISTHDSPIKFTIQIMDKRIIANLFDECVKEGLAKLMNNEFSQEEKTLFFWWLDNHVYPKFVIGVIVDNILVSICD